MQITLILRIIGIFIFGSAGAALAAQIVQIPAIPETIHIYVTIFGGVLGAILGFIITPRITLKPYNRFRHAIQQLPADIIFSATFGLFLGLALGAIAAYPLSLLPNPLGQFLPFIVAAAFGYIGLTLTTIRPDLLQGLRTRIFPKEGHVPTEAPVVEQCKPAVLLDTSVIIDGRIADICRTGFIQGELIVPLFVLNELQHVADSSDTLRRNRGRRGLEILRQLQEESPVPVRLTDADMPGVREVDDKLIALAKEMGGSILTNDYNLNRVAELQAVTVLNVNELANAVKTVLLPGESFSIHVLQEGKEQNQGVGYLDDGTMVVVEEGIRYIGATIDVTVSKILQTAAGRMIFARPDSNGD
ncbi:MAG TPA: PIN domain-containing protein [Anaerolineae bacterium]|nr:PIN domain-containing protein [Anaerolineae bacterium]HQI87055.1 PIN domain-containing protein [Anaerolineae bacterium]